MFLYYYDFPKISLVGKKSHLITFSVLSPFVTQSKLQTPFLTVPSPLLHASDHLVVAQALQRSSSPSTTQPSSLTKITICIHLTISSSSSLYCRHTAMFTGEIRQEHWWLLIGWGFNRSTAYIGYIPTHVYLLESPTDSFFCRWAEAVAGRHGFRHRKSLQSKCLKATTHI